MRSPSCIICPSMVIIMASWFFVITHAYNNNHNNYYYYSASSSSSRRTLFFGRSICGALATKTTTIEKSHNPNSHCFGPSYNGIATTTRGMWINMRKQKASDRRTRRKQRGEEAAIPSSFVVSVVDENASLWMSHGSASTTFMADTPEGILSTSASNHQYHGKKSLVANTPMKKAIWNHKQIHTPTTRLVTTSTTSPSNPTSSNRESSSGRGRSRKRTLLYQKLAQYQNHFLQLLSAEYQVEVCMFRTTT